VSIKEKVLVEPSVSEGYVENIRQSFLFSMQKSAHNASTGTLQVT
jgi:hypothetical protein